MLVIITARWFAGYSHELQGMSGMELRSHGTTGTYSLAVLYPNLECIQKSSARSICPTNLKKRQGFPDIRTVDYWLGGNKAERFPQSRSVAFLVLLVSF